MEVRAWAKINLTLEVLGKRPDGYHDVSTVLQTISLFDTLSFEPAEELVLESPGLSFGPEENLVFTAASALRQRSPHHPGARMRLQKGIPVAAGLGGGSSDAAATLLALNEMWGLGLSRAKLEAIAAGLGSDVPFFLTGGTALATGRGERVTPLPPLPETWLVVVKPPIPTPRDKTRRLYSLLDAASFTDGSHTRRLVEALEQGRLAPDMLFNAFDAVAPRAFPGLGAYRDALRQAGAASVHLAGSGPTLFALVESKEAAERVGEALGRTGLQSSQARTVS